MSYPNHWTVSNQVNPYHNHSLYPQMFETRPHLLPDNNMDQRQFQVLLQSIMKGIQGEAQAIDFYTRLIKQAPNERQRDSIQHALDDEKIHLQQFSQLYTELSGREPNYTFNPVQFRQYHEGLYKAYDSELEAYEMYRDVYLSTTDQRVRDIFLRAFTDEIEHASRFSFMYFDLQNTPGQRQTETGPDNIN
ncbi:ferritin family protein [Tuberibacillus sp. Marseille-P3662]|uniref:ferritin family protein n=1 Tax=Tuberibacillus sp. Marseille-P3662 TaxID=1965358 RepID=UPI000A1CDFF7|nr:ferritin-like domain-containing protein [Tuberibacillus sp. Marseille-P3662]